MASRVEFRVIPEHLRRAPEQYPTALPAEYRLYLDGEAVNAWVSCYYPNLQRGDADALDAAAASKLLTLTIAEASQAFTVMELPLVPPGAGVVDSVQFWLRQDEQEGDVVDVHFRIHPYLERWDKPWSLMALAEVLEALVREHGKLRNLEDEEPGGGPRDWGMGIMFMQRCELPPVATLQAAWDQIVPAAFELVEEATARLDRQSRPSEHRVEQLFDFPEAVRAACQQYLLYFVQFLRDLGVDADAALTDRAGRVLFSVTPRSGAEALSRVREALDAYLALAEHPEVFDAPGPKDIAVQQLGANVLHLRSQLQLAAALNAAKSAQIEALQLSNAHLRGAVLAPSAASLPKDEESVVEGVVSVTTIEGKGIRISLPEILRRLKRRLGD